MLTVLTNKGPLVILPGEPLSWHLKGMLSCRLARGILLALVE